MTEIFRLRVDDLTGLGGSMGSEAVREKYSKYFSSAHEAKRYAEKDYGKQISWIKDRDRIHSGDLRYIMYIITQLKIEDSAA